MKQNLSFFQKLSALQNKQAKVIQSSIHNKGVIAKKDIPKGTHIIQYVGDLITKKESDKRADIKLKKAKKDPSQGAVYIFTLDKKHDIDGDTWFNMAKFLNHSCNPNCEAEYDEEENEIWIAAKKHIKKGEELTYDYGYDIDNWEEHSCRCGSKNCVGYIVERDSWPQLKKKLLAKGKKLHKDWGKDI
jgi:SET domain-containing protein